MKNNKKILITGGCGFVGTNLTKYLLEKTSWEIKILDNLSSGTSKNSEHLKSFSSERVSFLKGDIRKKSDVKKAIRNCNFVVNLAAQVGVIPSKENPRNDAEINILGLLNLLEESKGKEKFIQASSNACLGEQEMPLNENKVPSPLAPYGASKLAGEGYCSAFSSSFGLKTVALRFSNVYGIFSDHKTSVVPTFIQNILNSKPVLIYGKGEQTRDLIYTKDVCKAIYLALTKELPNDFEIFQIGTGKETSIKELFEIIKSELEKEGYKTKPPAYKKSRKGEIKRNYSDIGKAKTILDFSPEVNLKEGVSKTVKWFLSSTK